jgi:hypothetical protein
MLEIRQQQEQQQIQVVVKVVQENQPRQHPANKNQETQNKI